MDTPTTDIGPGLGAFVAFFLLALLLWLLMRNMNGRMRRMAYVERERIEKLEAQQAADEKAAGGGGAPTAAHGDPTTPDTTPDDPSPETPDEQH